MRLSLLSALTLVTPQVAVLGDTVTDQAVEVTLNKLTEDHTTVIDDVSGLVDSLALEDRVVGLNFFGLLFLVALSATDGVAVLVAAKKSA